MQTTRTTASQEAKTEQSLHRLAPFWRGDPNSFAPAEQTRRHRAVLRGPSTTRSPREEQAMHTVNGAAARKDKQPCFQMDARRHSAASAPVTSSTVLTPHGSQPLKWSWKGLKPGKKYINK